LSIITISRGSYSRGKEIAEKLAERLGYDCICRESLFEDVEGLDARDAKLISAVDDIPSVFSRFQHGRETFITFIQSTLMQKLRKDNVVYEGFVGHVFLKDIPNILKVRIISGYEDRVNIVSERDRISKDQALKLIKIIDGKRKKWSQYLYDIDPSDSNQYDLVINVDQIPMEVAVDTLVKISGLTQFKMTSEAMKKIGNLALAAQMRNALLHNYSGVEVSAKEGKVFVSTDISSKSRIELIAEIERLAKIIPDLKEINLEFTIAYPFSREKLKESLVFTP